MSPTPVNTPSHPMATRDNGAGAYVPTQLIISLPPGWHPGSARRWTSHDQNMSWSPCLPLASHRSAEMPHPSGFTPAWGRCPRPAITALYDLRSRDITHALTDLFASPLGSSQGVRDASSSRLLSLGARDASSSRDAYECASKLFTLVPRRDYELVLRSV